MVLIAATGMAAGCSASTSSGPATAMTSEQTLPPSNANGRALTVASDECVNTTGYQYAQRGGLSLGPFMSDALSVPSGFAAAKLWVASQRDGHDAALLSIVGPAGSTEQQSRPPGEASVSNARQFYPGTIQIQEAGAYRIDVRVGKDRVCVIADFTVGR